MHLKNHFMEIANDITSLVGNTPLVKLNRIRKYCNCYPEILAKLESFNPSASVKDRIAYSMLSKAEEEGLITPVFPLVASIKVVLSGVINPSSSALHNIE